MSAETQAVVYNAVPLLVLAALYLVVAAALAPSFLSERARLRDVDVATALIFPCVGIAAAIAGVLVLVDGEPMVSHPVLLLVAIVIAWLPAIAFLARWQQRGVALAGASRAREAEGQRSARERELDTVSRLSLGLAGAVDPETVGGLLVAEACEVLGLDAAALAVVDESAATAEFAEARLRGVRMEWLVGRTMDLRSGPSGIASVVGTGEPFAVVDAPSSPRVSSELVERTGARSVVFVPLRTPERVAGVLVGAAQTAPRLYSRGGRAAAGPRGRGCARARAGAVGGRPARGARTGAADRADRRRHALRARPGRRPRRHSTRARRRARAVALPRQAGRPARRRVERGRARAGRRQGARDLPVTNLAQSGRRTTAVADVDTAPELDAEERERLLELGSRAALATPIDVDGETIGVLALHRAAPGPWPAGSVALAEAVARRGGPRDPHRASARRESPSSGASRPRCSMQARP